MAISTDTTFGAGRVSSRPIEYGAYGHFRLATVTGATVSLTAGDPIVSFRWTSSSSNCLLLRLSVTGNITSNIATTVNFDLAAYVARSFTASDSAGTAITVGAYQKKRTAMGNSGVGDFRIATTGKLTAGTRTLDTYPIAQINVPMAPTVTNVGSASFPLDMYVADAATGEHPILLAANEGLVITTPVAANTSGGVRYTFTFDWAEVPTSGTVSSPAF